MSKTRIGIVNYLNTKPLLYGLQRPPIADSIELVGDYPSRIAEMLNKDEVDLGLIPVAAIPEMGDCYIVGNHCIAADGEIASVALFSEVPLQEIQTIYLDYQSRTSATLLKFLVHEYWGINPEIKNSINEDYRQHIRGTTAGLVIGDRAFEQRRISTYFYDLGSEWKAITGLPFVFAVWVSRKKLPESFISKFEQANSLGLKHLDEIAAIQQFKYFDLKKYYKLHLNYQLDEMKRRSIALFLQYTNQYSFLQLDLPENKDTI